MATSNPSPDEIIALAEECGYRQRRPTVSATLFFIKETKGDHDNDNDLSPVLINIYPTTRSIMTQLHHPTSLTNALWRSNAYANLAELRSFLENPRLHTGKGYRNASQAVRGCVQCGEMKPRTAFSSNQWRKGPDANKCQECVTNGGVVGARDEEVIPDPASVVTSLLRNLKLDPTTPAALTEDALKTHNKENNNSKSLVKNENGNDNTDLLEPPLGLVVSSNSCIT